MLIDILSGFLYGVIITLILDIWEDIFNIK